MQDHLTRHIVKRNSRSEIEFVVEESDYWMVESVERWASGPQVALHAPANKSIVSVPRGLIVSMNGLYMGVHFKMVSMGLLKPCRQYADMLGVFRDRKKPD